MIEEIAPGIQAVKLPVLGDWADVAAWCGGEIKNERSRYGSDWYSYVFLPQAANGSSSRAHEGQWIVRYVDGTFAVFLDQQMPHAALWPSLWAKLAAHSGEGCACRGEPNVGCRDRDDDEYRARWALKTVVEHLGLKPEVPVSC